MQELEKRLFFLIILFIRWMHNCTKIAVIGHNIDVNYPVTVF